MGIKERIKNRLKNNLSELDIVALSLIGSNNESVKDKTHFQKEIFLIAINDEKLWNKANFIAHSFGQYSEPAEESLRNLRGYELVAENNIRLSSFGKEIYESLKASLPKEKREMIRDFKNLLNNLNQDELLVLMYYTYPEFSVESTVKEKIEKVRVPCALSLYKKKKVSLQKAAYLAGIPLEKFVKLTKE